MKNIYFISIGLFLLTLFSCETSTTDQNQCFSGLTTASFDIDYPFHIKKYNLVYRTYDYDYGHRKVTHSDRYVDSAWVNLLSDSSMLFGVSNQLRNSNSYYGGSFNRMSDTIVWRNDSLSQPRFFFEGGDELFDKDSVDIVVLRSNWSCSPWCEHGHISYNSSIFYSLNYGVFCNFDRKRKSNVEVLYSIDGISVKKKMILRILKRFDIEDAIVSAFESDELQSIPVK